MITEGATHSAIGGKGRVTCANDAKLDYQTPLLVALLCPNVENSPFRNLQGF